MSQEDKPTPANIPKGPKPGNILIKYIGKKTNFFEFKRPKLKAPIVFKNGIAEVTGSIGHALANAYPKTFKNLSGPEVKPDEVPEV